MVPSVEGRRTIVRTWRRILDPYFESTYQWIGRTALDMLEPTYRLEESWRRGAYWAWGRALYSALSSNPGLAAVLIPVAEKVADRDFRSRLLLVLNKGAVGDSR